MHQKSWENGRVFDKTFFEQPFSGTILQIKITISPIKMPLGGIMRMMAAEGARFACCYLLLAKKPTLTERCSLSATTKKKKSKKKDKNTTR